MSLRISNSAPLNSDRGVRWTAQEDRDSYLERLVKLVPSEVIVAYPMLKGSAGADPLILNWALPMAAWVLLAVVVVLRWHATSTPDRKPQWVAIVLSAISFIIWVNVIGGNFGVSSYTAMITPEGVFAGPPEQTNQFLSSLVLALWTMLVPLVYKGDDR